MLSCLPTSAYERFCERQSSTWRCRSVRGLERSKPKISEALGCSDRETTMRLLRIVWSLPSNVSRLTITTMVEEHYIVNRCCQCVAIPRNPIPTGRMARDTDRKKCDAPRCPRTLTLETDLSKSERCESALLAWNVAIYFGKSSLSARNRFRSVTTMPDLPSTSTQSAVATRIASAVARRFVSTWNRTVSILGRCVEFFS
jgi:hypothetical protein